MPGDFTITFHDWKDDTDDEIVERVDFGNRQRSEILPDDPDTKASQAIASVRAAPERYRRYAFRARNAAGELIGSAATQIDPEHDDNPDIMWFGIDIDASARRQGLGTQLLAELASVAVAENRPRLCATTADARDGGIAFARSLGAKHTITEHTNHLPVDEIDRRQLEQWVSDAKHRSSAYELFGWDGPVADDDMERYIDIIDVMNSAPRDDLEMNDFTVTPEEIRESEAVMAAVGISVWTLVVRHRETGEWAGFHDMIWNPESPTLMHVDSTGVKPGHRGSALGKWLKAAMTLRILDERPEVVSIRTGNADSNDAMLGINKAMGYRPLIGHVAYEVSTDAAHEWLRARGIEAQFSF